MAFPFLDPISDLTCFIVFYMKNPFDNFIKTSEDFESLT